MMARRVIAGRSGFSPKALFANGEQGVWYDPSDFSTLFQDAAGTTPVTAVEQPVGLMLDKSKGLVLGSELVTNGTFDTDTNGWSTITAGGAVAALSNINGTLQVAVVSGTNSYASATIATVAGKSYRATFTIVESSKPTTRFLIGTVAGYPNLYGSVNLPTGTHTVVFTAGGAVTHLTAGLDAAVAGDTIRFDNISVRELPGNHAFQTTSANRPVLSARYNLLTKTEQFDDAAWPKGGATIDSTSITSPLGTPTAKRVTINSNSVGIYQLVTTPVATGHTFRLSVFLKAASATTINIGINGLQNGENNKGTQLNITTEWAQYTYDFVAGGSDSGLYALVASNTALSPASAIGSSRTIDVWGADLRVANDALNQPAYQRVNTSTDYDTVGFKPYLSFNGTNQWLQTNSIDFTYGDKMFVSAGVLRLIDSAGVISELSNDWNNNNGSFLCWGGSYIYGTGNAFNSASRGTSTASAGQFGYTQSAFTPPVTAVVSATHDIAGSLTVVRGNGTAGANGIGSKGTGNYGNYPLYIGARGGSSLYFNGRLYSLIVRGAQTPANLIAATERYVARKTGVVL